MCTLIVTNLLNEPFDEGAKNAVKNMLSSYKKNFPCTIVAVNSNADSSLFDMNFALNKLLFAPSFYRFLRKHTSPRILYIPEASTTLPTFVRAWLLKLFTGKKVIIFSLQPRSYSLFKRLMIKLIKPAKIVTQSKKTAAELIGMGVNTDVLPLGVDNARYREGDHFEKIRLREKYGINKSAKVLLHVGHIKKARNLSWMVEIKKKFPDIEIIVVGSTTFEKEDKINELLLASGVMVFRKHLPAIEEVYRLSDYYIFPVLENDAAIETPLSVLEAMSTNLPVLTTPFGSLPDVFQEDEYLRFVNSPEDAIKTLRAGFSAPCKNREKMASFTWNHITHKLEQLLQCI